MLFGCKQTVPPTVVTGEFEKYLDKEFFEYVTDLADNMIICYLEGHEWIWANKRFYQHFGYRDIKDFYKKHKSIRELFLCESEEIFTESDKSWLDYISRYENSGYRVTIEKEGDDVIIVDAYTHRYPKNQSLYILELKDVTKIYKAKQQEKEVEKLKSRFLANISHEFRTPMNGIMGFLDLLEETELTPKQREYVAMIAKSSKGLLHNIEILLDLAQLQSNRLELLHDSFNLLPKMEKIVDYYYKLGKEKGVAVYNFIDPKIPKRLEGDVYRISQVMNALCKNAVKFTPRGGKVIVEVKVLKHFADGECTIGFRIKDTGKGISKEQMAFIEEPFSAGNHADERMGVGLSLSFGLVKLMGSQLHIKSEENRGTEVSFELTFSNAKESNFSMVTNRKVRVVLLDKGRIDEANFLTLYLKSFGIDVLKANMIEENIYDEVDSLYIIANQNEASWVTDLEEKPKKVPVTLLVDDDETLSANVANIVDSALHRPILPSVMAEHLYSIHKGGLLEEAEMVSLKESMKALVVEDNLINQRLIQILLEEYGLLVDTAGNGLEAVEKVEQNSYDIVFMDIDMPQMNGIAATKEIKSKLRVDKKLPIVALTAMAMEGDREMLLAEGLDDYLAKPLTKTKLEQVLNKYLHVNL
jgi:signal transduction histidine kinase/CheY-like chemotaxis protein